MEEKEFQDKINKALENIGKMEESMVFIKNNQEIVDKTLNENPDLAEGLASSARKLGNELNKLEENIKKIKSDQKWFLVWESWGSPDDTLQKVLLETTNREDADKMRSGWLLRNGAIDGAACYVYEFSVKEDFDEFKKSFEK
jgi:hypothetical protein